MSLRNNATNVQIDEPYFIFRLTNLEVYKIWVITSRTRNVIVIVMNYDWYL